MRGIAALAVTYFHLTGSTGLSGKIANSGKYGYLGVEAFFVISGFIIPYSMGKSGYTIQRLAQFLKRRYARLSPPYLAAILISLLITLLAQGSCRQWLSVKLLLYHAGFLVDIFSMKWMNPVFWSLAIEMQFYIFIGLLFPLVFNENKIVSSSSIILTTLLPCFPLKEAYLPHWLSLFNMGLIVFCTHTEKYNKSTLLVLLISNVLICILRVGMAEAIVGVTACLFLILSLELNIKRIYQPLIKLGAISYSLYLVHWELGRAGVAIARHIPYLGKHEPFRLIVGLSIATISAIILYFFVEKKAIYFSKKI